MGYRWHDTKKIPALFPFGHGLSYTDFTYSNPRADSKTLTDGGTLTASVTVKNTGDCEGKEIVQLYIGDDKASVLRPLKELKAFAKVSLQPGQEETVTFPVTVDDLKFYDEATSSWKAEPGKFTIYIGASSTDIKAKIPFELK